MIVHSKKVRTVLAAAAILLPHGLRRLVHRRFLGYDIHPTARIGRAFIDVDRLTMSEGAAIGSLTVMRGCEDVVMREEAIIGSLVWVHSVRKGEGYFAGQDRHCALIMERGSIITCLHILDCCDTIEFGAYSGLGGFGSQVLTHSVDIVTIKLRTQPVRLGHHAMVGTRSVILPGVIIPACSVVSAGSVMDISSIDDGPRLYIGRPAVARRKLRPELLPYLTRTQSHSW